MNAELVNRTPQYSIDARAREVAKQRDREHADALDFVVYGDEDGRHTSKCVHALAGREPCSRTYDPRPYAEALPAESRMYAGTGVGLLYGLPGSEVHAWQLAGWNLAPGSTR